MMLDQETLNEIINNIGLPVNSDGIDYTKSFSEVGLDSLDFFSLLSELEERFGITFSEDQYQSLNNLNDVILMVNSQGCD